MEARLRLFFLTSINRIRSATLCVAWKLAERTYTHSQGKMSLPDPAVSELPQSTAAEPSRRSSRLAVGFEIAARLDDLVESECHVDDGLQAVTLEPLNDILNR